MFRLANYLFRAALYSKCGEDEMIERFKKIERKFFVISRYANNNFQISSRCRIRTKFHSYPSIQQESYKVVFKLESTSLKRRRLKLTSTDKVYRVYTTQDFRTSSGSKSYFEYYFFHKTQPLPRICASVPQSV